jgi:hypothetical protein
VDVGDRGAGEAAIPVADAESVIIQVESLADLAERHPEVGERVLVQVKHVVDVLVGDYEQVHTGPAVGELVGRHRPVLGLEDHLLARVLAQLGRAEQADARRLKPPHFRQLLLGPVVIRAVEPQPVPPP